MKIGIIVQVVLSGILIIMVAVSGKILSDIRESLTPYNFIETSNTVNAAGLITSGFYNDQPLSDPSNWFDIFNFREELKKNKQEVEK